MVAELARAQGMRPENVAPALRTRSMGDVVITGIGLVTPLGGDAGEVLDRVLSGVSAAQAAPFSPPIVCRQFAPVADFDAQRCFPDNKTLRLMNREA